METTEGLLKKISKLLLMLSITSNKVSLFHEPSYFMNSAL